MTSSPGQGQRWGVSLPFSDEGLAQQIDQYRELADAGYTDFWTLEASGWDAFTPLAMVASSIPHARFGTAIVPVFSRGAATLAGHAAAMAELFADRFTLGIALRPEPSLRTGTASPTTSHSTAPRTHCRSCSAHWPGRRSQRSSARARYGTSSSSAPRRCRHARWSPPCAPAC